MPNPTDPRAVADDPSGIVQQMPEVATEVLTDLRASITPGPWVVGYTETHIVGLNDRGICSTGGFNDNRIPQDKILAENTANSRAIALLPDLLYEVIAHRARRATEADLRAEIERLRAVLAELADACEAYPVNVPRADAALSASRAALPPPKPMEASDGA